MCPDMRAQYHSSPRDSSRRHAGSDGEVSSALPVSSSNMATCDRVDSISPARAILEFVERLIFWLVGFGMHRRIGPLWRLVRESRAFSSARCLWCWAEGCLTGKRACGDQRSRQSPFAGSGAVVQLRGSPSGRVATRDRVDCLSLAFVLQCSRAYRRTPVWLLVIAWIAFLLIEQFYNSSSG